VLDLIDATNSSVCGEYGVQYVITNSSLEYNHHPTGLTCPCARFRPNAKDSIFMQR
jgi:hypothetical protein